MMNIAPFVSLGDPQLSHRGGRVDWVMQIPNFAWVLNAQMTTQWLDLFALERALAVAPTSARTQPDLPFAACDGRGVVMEVPVGTAATPVARERHALALAEELFGVVRRLVGTIEEPKTEAEFAGLLGVSKAQAKSWLVRLVAEGFLQKSKRPVRYRCVRPGDGTGA